jgi:RNA polymerase sigma-70 factor (ECF subfamily)
MATPPERESSINGENGWFVSTHWSVVWKARNGDSTQAIDALNKLCTAYWRPLFYYLRRRGHGFEEARDLTQSFFTHLLQADQLQHLKHQEGRFRNFLLTLLNHHVSDERDKAHALKRGGGQAPVFLDALTEEERYRTEPSEGASPEVLFDRVWAQTVLERAGRRLREEYEAAGNGRLFEVLRQLSPGRTGSAYAEAASKLGLSESAVASAIFRLRRRQAEVIREEVAQTVTQTDDIDEEIRYLMDVVAR